MADDALLDALTADLAGDPRIDGFSPEQTAPVANQAPSEPDALPAASDGADPLGILELTTADSSTSAAEPQPEQADDVFAEFGGRDIVTSLKPIAEALYNPAATVDERIAALEGASPGAVDDILWSIADRPQTRELLVQHYLGMPYSQAMQRLQGAASAQPAEEPHLQLPTDEWGHPIELPDSVKSFVAAREAETRTLQSRLQQLEGGLAQQQREQWSATAAQEQQGFLTELMTGAAEVGKKYLTPADDDSAEVQELKQQAYDIYLQSIPDTVEKDERIGKLAKNAHGLYGVSQGRDRAERLKPAVKAGVSRLAENSAKFMSKLVDAYVELQGIKAGKQPTTTAQTPTSTSSKPTQAAAQPTRKSSTTLSEAVFPDTGWDMDAIGEELEKAAAARAGLRQSWGRG
jgi:hypothetical protein